MANKFRFFGFIFIGICLAIQGIADQKGLNNKVDLFSLKVQSIEYKADLIRETQEALSVAKEKLESKDSVFGMDEKILLAVAIGGLIIHGSFIGRDVIKNGSSLKKAFVENTRFQNLRTYVEGVKNTFAPNYYSRSRMAEFTTFTTFWGLANSHLISSGLLILDKLLDELTGEDRELIIAEIESLEEQLSMQELELADIHSKLVGSK